MERLHITDIVTREKTKEMTTTNFIEASLLGSLPCGDPWIDTSTESVIKALDTLPLHLIFDILDDSIAIKDFEDHRAKMSIVMNELLNGYKEGQCFNSTYVLRPMAVKDMFWEGEGPIFAYDLDLVIGVYVMRPKCSKRRVAWAREQAAAVALFLSHENQIRLRTADYFGSTEELYIQSMSVNVPIRISASRVIYVECFDFENISDMNIDAYLNFI